jgi:hypothetical protein
MKKIYSYNEEFFKKIDSEEKAYFLGLMYADGCIERRQSKVCKNIQHKVCLSMLDLEILEKFNNSLEGNSVIKERVLKNGKKFYSLIMTSRKMVESLIDKGCVERKSLILKFPNLPRNLVYDFIRGYFDGDGSIFSSSQRVKRNSAIFIYTRPVVHICGTREFLETMAPLIGMTTKHIKKEKRRMSNSWYIRFDGFSKVENFYKLLYTNKKCFLSRKKNKFVEIAKQRGSETIIGTPTRGKYKRK